MNGLSELLHIGFLMLEAVMIEKFLRPPSEIQNLFESTWSLSRRSFCVVLYIPRVRSAMYLVDPV